MQKEVPSHFCSFISFRWVVVPLWSTSFALVLFAHWWVGLVIENTITLFCLFFVEGALNTTLECLRQE